MKREKILWDLETRKNAAMRRGDGDKWADYLDAIRAVKEAATDAEPEDIAFAVLPKWQQAWGFLFWIILAIIVIVLTLVAVVR
jgi:hypothetical protein